MEWTYDFQVGLNKRERPSCGKEAEVSSSLPFMRTGGKSGLQSNDNLHGLALLEQHLADFS